MKYTSLFLILFSFLNVLLTQTTKKFTGELTNDGKFGQHGVVVYSYYEDSITSDHIKHGPFKYTFEGAGEYTGLNQTIIGEFHQGKKKGKWVYTITKKDYKEGHENKYYTGHINLTAHYENGNANGEWKYNSTSKYRSQIPKYPGFIWSDYNMIGYDTIVASFNTNITTNKIHIVDKYNNFYADANFDSNGMCDGNWHIIDNSLSLDKIIKFSSGYRTEELHRNVNDLSFVNNTNNLIFYERLKYYNSLDMDNQERLKCSIDTISSIGSELFFNTYYNRLLNDENFLYQSIGGDNSYWDKFNGSFEILFNEFYSLKDMNGFMENYNNYFTEDSAYNIFKSHHKSIDDIMPNERGLIDGFLKKMENVNRLGILKNFNDYRYKKDTLNMFLIWNQSNIRYDQLNKEDKTIVDQLNSSFKREIENSAVFSATLDKYTRDLFKKYSDFLNKHKLNSTDQTTKKNNTIIPTSNCLIDENIFIEVLDIDDWTSSIKRSYIPILDSSNFYSVISKYTAQMNSTDSNYISIVKNYYELYNQIIETSQLVPQVSITFNKREIQYSGGNDLVSKYTSKFYNVLYLGDFNDSLNELNQKLIDFKTLVDSVPLDKNSSSRSYPVDGW
jgi:hypothetical protein